MYDTACQLLKALGLTEDRIAKATIVIDFNAEVIVTVATERFVFCPDLGELERVAEQYDLVRTTRETH